MKLTVLDGHGLNPGDISWDSVKSLVDEFCVYDRTPQELVVERIADSDLILLNKVCITRKIIESCSSLKYIGVLATGYNVVDLKACKDHGVVVTNIPAYSTDAVAQHTFAFILSFTNKVAEHNQSVKNGGWISSKDFCYWTSPLTELNGKKIGIVGYGNIGSKVAAIARAFGMTVVTVNESERAKKDGVDSVSLDGLKDCDFISLHCPLTQDNAGMFNSKLINRICSSKTILINTARGGLINEKDVADALKNGALGGYACDVVLDEPMKNDNPLLTAPNCLITPHIAWAPLETRLRLLNVAVNNIKQFLSGSPVNVVN